MVRCECNKYTTRTTCDRTNQWNLLRHQWLLQAFQLPVSMIESNFQNYVRNQYWKCMLTQEQLVLRPVRVKQWYGTFVVHQSASNLISSANKTKIINNSDARDLHTNWRRRKRYVYTTYHGYYLEFATTALFFCRCVVLSVILLVAQCDRQDFEYRFTFDCERQSTSSNIQPWR